jgi:hypothetical protein
MRRRGERKDCVQSSSSPRRHAVLHPRVAASPCLRVFFPPSSLILHPSFLLRVHEPEVVAARTAIGVNLPAVIAGRADARAVEHAHRMERHTFSDAVGRVADAASDVRAVTVAVDKARRGLYGVRRWRVMSASEILRTRRGGRFFAAAPRDQKDEINERARLLHQAEAARSHYWQVENLKLATRVLQLKVPLVFRYSVVYHTVQSSTGSTLRLL